MAPTTKSTTGRAAASQSTDATMNNSLQEELTAAQAEIELLRSQLAARHERDSSPIQPGLTTVLEALLRRLEQAPSPRTYLQRSVKVPDPPVLTDGKDPTFSS